MALLGSFSVIVKFRVIFGNLRLKSNSDIVSPGDGNESRDNIPDLIGATWDQLILSFS